MLTSYFSQGETTLYQGDCIDVMSAMPDNCIDLIIADPPYFKVKSEAWDRQWDKPKQFLEWLDGVAMQWQRILKPNGSLYCFASPKMAARVECLLGQRFNVLNQVVWTKANEPTHALKYGDDRFRQYVQKSERIIFCEHIGADNIAKGEAGYEAKCDELRGFVFEPLRAYLAGEWERAGLVNRDANEATNSQMAGHYLTRTQWALPTADKYSQLRVYANRNGGSYLMREYEDLRREYEDLRRPFSVSADVPYTDVWDFPTVQHYPGKHPCEKPLAMIRHMVKASGKSGCVVLDPFAGSGVTLEAARQEGMACIGIEKDEAYCKAISKRLGQCQTLFEMAA